MVQVFLVLVNLHNTVWSKVFTINCQSNSYGAPCLQTISSTKAFVVALSVCVVNGNNLRPSCQIVSKHCYVLVYRWKWSSNINCDSVKNSALTIGIRFRGALGLSFRDFLHMIDTRIQHRNTFLSNRNFLALHRMSFEIIGVEWVQLNQTPVSVICLNRVHKSLKCGSTITETK